MKNESGFTLFEVGVLVTIVGAIALFGWVVLHFISKLW